MISPTSRAERTPSLALTNRAPVGTAGVATGPLLVAAVLAFAIGVAISRSWVGGDSSIDAGHARSGLRSLPLAAQAPVSAALGADSSAYRVSRWGVGLRALNPVQHLTTTFSDSGVLVRSGAARVGLHLGAMGAGDSLTPVGRVAPRFAADRVAYRHAGVSEWYSNGPLGLEQGFDVAAHPARGRGPLTLSLALSGDVRARLDRSGVLLTGAGATLRYGGLYASDARGRQLRSWLELRGDHILIRVADPGAVYPLRIDPILQQAELAASELPPSQEVTGAGFGSAVAVSGDTIVVGAGTAEGDQGAVYVFVKPASGWANATQTAKLTAPAGGQAPLLGLAVAISGDTIVAGARGANNELGAAYVFVKPASGWANATPTAELTASDTAGLARAAGGIKVEVTATSGFGLGVAISGDTVVVGDPAHKVGGHAGQGAAYVFERPASGWANETQIAELTASDGSAGDEFGRQLAVAGNTIVVGDEAHKVGVNVSQGAVYVFEKPVGGWASATQTAELTTSPTTPYENFGGHVAISEGTIVATGGIKVDPNRASGAAYVFVQPAAGWANVTQTAELTAPAGSGGDFAGLGVAISGERIIVGAGRPNIAPIPSVQLAAYVFEKPASGWTNATPTAELAVSNGRMRGKNATVSVSGETVVVGRLGAAYVFAGQSPSIKAPLAIVGLRQSASVWRESSRLPQISRSATPTGTTFSFELNEPAAVELKFTKRAPGRKAHGKCVGAGVNHSSQLRCTRIVVAGTISLTAHAGVDKIRFSGALSRGRKLKPGRYTLTIDANNTATGQVAASTPLTFTIVK
jgi:hypothetical protein